MHSLLTGFMSDDAGAQVIEYALIIAVISLALIVVLKALTDNGSGLSTLIDRVTNCLTTTTCA